MLLKTSCFCTAHKPSVSTGFAEQIMPILHILCYNGSLVTWTVVSLTTSKFKPLPMALVSCSYSTDTPYSPVVGPWWYHIVRYRTIPSQRLGKHIPAQAYARKNRTSIDRQWICKQSFSTIERICFVRGRCRRVIKGQRRSFEWVGSEESSLRNQQLQNNGKKGIRRCKEDFIGDLKWQWDCCNSVARIRPVKAENPSACVTANCKLCRVAIALYYL
jgi:hypothetical protein